MEKITIKEIIQAVGGTLLIRESEKTEYFEREEEQEKEEGADRSMEPEKRGEESEETENHERAEKVKKQMQAGTLSQTVVTSVVTDSRKIVEGCVFFALSGERFDGHAYVKSALEKGAAGCVISKEPLPEDMVSGKFYVLVPDTRHALGDLAHYYRKKYDVKVVGITGSVGKTTCREMVQAVLARHFRVHATFGNFNNDIGLPLTIFDMSKEDEVLVLEMGMNHPGEIRRLAEIAEPDIAVITNVGTAHIGFLGSRENIFRAKAEIFDGLRPGGTAILCGDDDYLPRLALEEGRGLREKFRLLYAGTGENCDCRVLDPRVEIRTAKDPAAPTEGQEERVFMETTCRILLPEQGTEITDKKDKPESREKSLSEHKTGITEKNDTPKPREKSLPEQKTGLPKKKDMLELREKSLPEQKTGLLKQEKENAEPGRKNIIMAAIPAAGLHLIYPASIAAAVGDVLGMSPGEIEAGIGDFKGQRMPLERCSIDPPYSAENSGNTENTKDSKTGEFFLFDDTYNASLESMKSSLQVLACMSTAVPGIRRIAVLGDMFEQGDHAEALHREVGRTAAETGVDTLVAIGKLSRVMAAAAREAGLPDVREFADRDSAAETIRTLTKPGTALLFKASHGMQLDRLAAVCREQGKKQSGDENKDIC